MHVTNTRAAKYQTGTTSIIIFLNNLPTIAIHLRAYFTTYNMPTCPNTRQSHENVFYAPRIDIKYALPMTKCQVKVREFRTLRKVRMVRRKFCELWRRVVHYVRCACSKKTCAKCRNIFANAWLNARHLCCSYSGGYQGSKEQEQNDPRILRSPASPPRSLKITLTEILYPPGNRIAWSRGKDTVSGRVGQKGQEKRNEPDLQARGSRRVTWH